MYKSNKKIQTKYGLLVFQMLICLSNTIQAQSDNLIIENRNINQNENYAAQSITFGPDITITAEGNVTLNSNTLAVKPKFVILSGGQLNVISGAVAVGVEPETKNVLPKDFNVRQNYPNPFNPQTTIAYELAQNSFIKIAVYDILGQKIKTLVNENKQAGYHKARFDAANLPSGVYYALVQAGTHQKVIKMMLVK